MRIGQAWEKRDWGGPRPTWRLVPATMERYPRGTSGPSRYAVRIASRKAAKRLVTAGDSFRPY